MHKAYIALGSNLGDKEKNIKKALSLIEKKYIILKTSSFYKTEPVGFLNQDWFLNCVVKIKTNLKPLKLLEFLKNIEKKLKRIKTFKNGPRIIDLDILFYEDKIISEKKLTIPHPEIHKRLFVLEPMCEIEKDFVHPILQKTILALKNELS